MAGYKSLCQNFTLLVTTTFLLLNLSLASKNKTIHILCLLPYPDSHLKADRSYGPVISMALELAQEQINSQTELLPDHKIELIQDDSGCEHTTSTKIDLAYESFVRNIQFHREKLVGIIGPDCTSSSFAIAPLLNHKEISLVAVHGGVSPLLSNRTQYPYALGALVSNENFITLATNFKQQANWSRVGVLLDESQLHLQTENLVSMQVMDNLNINVSFLSITGLGDPLSLVVDEGLRVNFLFTSAANTQRLLCMAKHRKMVYDTYQWIVVNHLLEDIAQNVYYSTRYGKTKHFCSKSDMRKFALNGVLFLNNRLSPLNESAPTTYSKFSFNDFEQKLHNRINIYNSQYSYNITYSPWSTYYYDSLWTWTIALDRLTRQNLSVDPTCYDDRRVLSNLILAEFYALDFDGVSGRVKFENGSRFLTREVSVIQYENDEQKLVATFDGKELVQHLNIAYIPDSFENQAFGVNDAQAIVFGIITAIELVIIVALHILTIKYRNLPSVKASSFKLSQLVFLGSYVFIIAVFLTILIRYPSFIGREFLCTTKWTWLIPFSYTLTFGTLSVKTWRLYNIFFRYLNPSKYIGNCYLAAFVFGLLLIDAIYGSVWTALNPHHIVLRNTTTIDGVTKFLVIDETCSNENGSIWYGIAYGYRSLLLIVLVVLTVLTYRIPNPSFSTRILRVTNFLFTIITVTGLTIFHLLHLISTTPTLSPWFIEMITFNLLVVLEIALFTYPLIPKLKEWTQCFWKEE